MSLADDVCYLTTTGRISGRPHTIEIWFAHRDGTIYFLSGGGDRSDWVRNLIHRPPVTIRVEAGEMSGRARLVDQEAEDRLARELVFAKYQPGYGGDLSRWRDRSLPIAIDLEAEPTK